MTDYGPLPEPSAWRCCWRECDVVTDAQWHDDADPMPDEWEDGAPNEVTPHYTADQMRAYAAQAVAAERERCAKLCEAARPRGGRAFDVMQSACFDALTHVAAAIRAA